MNPAFPHAILLLLQGLVKFVHDIMTALDLPQLADNRDNPALRLRRIAPADDPGTLAMPDLPRAAGAAPSIARRCRSVAVLLAIALLAACAPLPPRNPLARWAPSPNHDGRRAVLIVLHATEQDSVRRSLDTLRTRNRSGPVSAHYLIGRDGALYQLVADSERAWHAGAGRWGTISDVNSASIGIELDNDGTAPFPPQQIDSLLRLLEDVTTRLRIPRTQVIAHADLAPTRKVDPSRLFPWPRLAEAGFGLWPRGEMDDPPPGFDPWLALRAIGYPLDDRAATVRAFRRHFRADEADALDAEDLRILHALVRSE